MTVICAGCGVSFTRKRSNFTGRLSFHSNACYQGYRARLAMTPRQRQERNSDRQWERYNNDPKVRAHQQEYSRNYHRSNKGRLDNLTPEQELGLDLTHTVPERRWRNSDGGVTLLDTVELPPWAKCGWRCCRCGKESGRRYRSFAAAESAAHQHIKKAACGTHVE